MKRKMGQRRKSLRNVVLTGFIHLSMKRHFIVALEGIELKRILGIWVTNIDKYSSATGAEKANNHFPHEEIGKWLARAARILPISWMREMQQGKGKTWKIGWVWDLILDIQSKQWRRARQGSCEGTNELSTVFCFSMHLFSVFLYLRRNTRNKVNSRLLHMFECIVIFCKYFVW